MTRTSRVVAVVLLAAGVAACGKDPSSANSSASLEDRVTALETSVQDLTSKLQEAQDTIDKNKADISALQSTVDDQEREINELKQRSND